MPAGADAERRQRGPVPGRRPAGRSCARLLARNHLFVRGEAAARELPPVVNLPRLIHSGLRQQFKRALLVFFASFN